MLDESPAGVSDGGRGAIKIIAINPTLRAECERLLPILEREKQPAEPEDILRILVRHAPVYGIRAANPGEWATLFGAYLDALEGLPACAIEDAFLRWNRGEGHKDPMMREFYPKPPQLVHLAQEMRREMFSASYRARKALDYVEASAPRLTEEDRKARAQDFKALASELGSRVRRVVEPARPMKSPQQVAAELRAAAEDVL